MASTFWFGKFCNCWSCLLFCLCGIFHCVTLILCFSSFFSLSFVLRFLFSMFFVVSCVFVLQNKFLIMGKQRESESESEHSLTEALWNEGTGIVKSKSKIIDLYFKHLLNYSRNTSAPLQHNETKPTSMWTVFPTCLYCLSACVKVWLSRSPMAPQHLFYSASTGVTYPLNAATSWKLMERKNDSHWVYIDLSWDSGRQK